MPPAVPPDYRSVRLIGSGGMADVWEAIDERSGSPVALKILRTYDPALAGRLRREGAALARLDHPGLVRLLDAGVVDGHPYVAMELVRGTPLSTLLESGPMGSSATARMGAEVAAALDCVHRAGIVHRDVKPSNILVDADGRPHLADFGVAQLGDATALTAVDTTVGTVAYMAPEQLESHSVGTAADVFSLGMVLLECLTGERAYQGSPAEVVGRRLAGPVRLPEHLPAAWQGALAPMVDRSPGRRPPAAEVAAMLGALADPAPTAVHPAVAATVIAPAAVATRVLPTARRRRRRAPGLVAAGVVAAAIALAAWLASGGPPTKATPATGPTQPTRATAATTTTVPSALTVVLQALGAAQADGGLAPGAVAAIAADARQAVADTPANPDRAATDLAQAEARLSSAADDPSTTQAVGSALQALGASLGLAAPAITTPPTTPAPTTPAPAHGKGHGKGGKGGGD